MARVLPVGPARISQPQHEGHGGTDYAVPHGTPVAAAAAGVVVETGWVGTYGWRVVVQHPDGVRTTYNHLSEMSVRPGQQVSAGGLVGKVGSTGRSTGPHLHFEVVVNGQRINPEDWLTGAGTPNLGAGGQGGRFATTIERTGVRITPVQAESAWTSPTQVDITAADSRFGYAANESRFGVTAEEFRSIGEAVQADMAEGGMGLGDVQWESMVGKDYVSSPGGGGGQGASNLVSLAQQAGFTPEQARIMAAVAMAESSGNPKAHNPNASTGDNSYGLWQINMLGGMGPERRRLFGISSNEQLFDPVVNAKAAKAIFDQQGFGAWSVYKSGAYRRYL